MLSREHELVSLIMDSNCGSDHAIAPLSLQIYDLQSGVQGVTRMDFIEKGSYPPLWHSSIFEEVARTAKEKAFDICKAALIKAVVEVFGDEKNEEILWKSGDLENPGGEFVRRMVDWIKQYVNVQSKRDDLAICASLSLGNLTRKGEQ